MHNGHDIRTDPVNLAVDEPLAIGRTAFASGWLTIEIQLQDVRRRHLGRRDGPRNQVTARAGPGTDADVTERVNNVLRGQNVVRGHHVVNERFSRCLLPGQPPRQERRGAEKQDLTPSMEIHAC